jgi:hypothetical protein
LSSSNDVYRRALRALRKADVPFLVCGAYAFQTYTGLARRTKDLDIAVEPPDCRRALEALRRAGFRTEMTFSHWLAKARRDGCFVDILFASGNGVCRVDGEWFRHAPEAKAFGVPALLCPPEEMIWSKAYVMERERFDGADVAHLLRACGKSLDWGRLERRFAGSERLFLAHLLLFGFVYPAEAGAVPRAVLDRLWRRARSEPSAPRGACRGTLLSRAQYLVDVTKWGYADPRLAPRGAMTRRQVRDWTRAIFGRPRRVAVKNMIGVPAAESGRSLPGHPPRRYAGRRRAPAR